MARIVRFHEHGGPEVLRIENVDIPGPGWGEIQVRVKALGLNRAEGVAAFGRVYRNAGITFRPWP
jgi:NADPH:quinone reductase-like Zn-dependent oxidoreductase